MKKNYQNQLSDIDLEAIKMPLLSHPLPQYSQTSRIMSPQLEEIRHKPELTHNITYLRTAGCQSALSSSHDQHRCPVLQ